MKTVFVFITTLLLSLGSAAGPKSHSYQKPGAPIRLASPESIQLEPMSQETITITFATPLTGELVIAPKAKDGIRISDTSEKTFDLSKGQASMDIRVETEQEGHYHVMFHARINQYGANTTRVFGIAVQVGNPAPVAQKSHPKYVILPAQETIKSGTD